MDSEVWPLHLTEGSGVDILPCGVGAYRMRVCWLWRWSAAEAAKAAVSHTFFLLTCSMVAAPPTSWSIIDQARWASVAQRRMLTAAYHIVLTSAESFFLNVLTAALGNMAEVGIFNKNDSIEPQRRSILLRMNALFMAFSIRVSQCIFSRWLLHLFVSIRSINILWACWSPWIVIAATWRTITPP